MATSSSAIAKTYYRRSSLPPPNRIQYYPLPTSFNTGYIPKLNENQRDQRTFGLSSCRYQPKAILYDSRSPSLAQEVKYGDARRNKIEPDIVLSKEPEERNKINLTLRDKNNHCKHEPKTNSTYGHKFAYLKRDRIMVSPMLLDVSPSSSNTKMLSKKNESYQEKNAKNILNEKQNSPWSIETRRNGQNVQPKRFNFTSKSSSRPDIYKTQTRQFENSITKKKVTYVKDNGNKSDLDNSYQTSSSKYDDKIIPSRTETVSKFCRFSKYIDILHTPLSTLERLSYKKKGSDTVTNKSGEHHILVSPQNDRRGSVGKDKDTIVRRSKTAPVESSQQRKLQEYISWQNEQNQKRSRLQRYLKSVQHSNEPEELTTRSKFLGPIRVGSPLYFVYRSPEQTRKVPSAPTRKENLDVPVAPKQVIKNTSQTPSRPLDSGRNSITSVETVPNNPPKDTVPREIIQARSAFDTIKNYCNNLIRSANKTSHSTQDDENRNSMNLNFFAKPIVDRPISIP